MIMMLVLLMLAIGLSCPVRAIHTPLRDIYTNPIDYLIWKGNVHIARKRALNRQVQSSLKKLGNFKPRWNQSVELKGGLRIYTPWYMKPFCKSYWKDWKVYPKIAIFVTVLIASWYSIGLPIILPMATFTSKATGGWDTEGQTTWNEVGHPIAGDTVTIQNTHTISCESATACTNLTIDSGGSLTTTVSDYSLTVSNLTSITGTLTSNASAISLGSGVTSAYAVDVNSGGTLTGGTGTHTMGSIIIDAGGTWDATTGTTTIDSEFTGGNRCISDSGTTNHNNGNITITSPTTTLLLASFYDLVINSAGTITQSSSSITISNNFTITAGTWDTTTNDRDITVTGTSTIDGTLTLNGSTVTLTGATTVNSGGTLTLASGGTVTAGAAWTHSGTITNNGTIDMATYFINSVGNNTGTIDGSGTFKNGKAYFSSLASGADLFGENFQFSHDMTTGGETVEWPHRGIDADEYIDRREWLNYDPIGADWIW